MTCSKARGVKWIKLLNTTIQSILQKVEPAKYKNVAKRVTRKGNYLAPLYSANILPLTRTLVLSYKLLSIILI